MSTRLSSRDAGKGSTGVQLQTYSLPVTGASNPAVSGPGMLWGPRRFWGEFTARLSGSSSTRPSTSHARSRSVLGEPSRSPAAVALGGGGPSIRRLSSTASVGAEDAEALYSIGVLYSTTTDPTPLSGPPHRAVLLGIARRRRGIFQIGTCRHFLWRRTRTGPAVFGMNLHPRRIAERHSVGRPTRLLEAVVLGGVLDRPSLHRTECGPEPP